MRPQRGGEDRAGAGKIVATLNPPKLLQFYSYPDLVSSELIFLNLALQTIGLQALHFPDCHSGYRQRPNQPNTCDNNVHANSTYDQHAISDDEVISNVK